MKIACIAAHQDDEMHCLGTLLKYRQRGDDIAFICVSNGELGASWDNASKPHEIAALRQKEMDDVAAALGADYICLDRPDGFIFDSPDLRREMIDAIRRVRADVIFTHWTSDYIPDHSVVASVVEYAALYAQIDSVLPAIPALSAAPAIFYMNPGDGYGFEPSHFVELDDDTLTEKLRVLRLHASQMAVMRELRGYDYADIMEQDARRQGARVMRNFAESFRPCLLERRTPLSNLLP
ncbi:LmbE family N-acetylglucosaminyl deacetylase [Mesorhizobium robiniae]|uniref:LmbE family N-acetylglucosaminyl deacetylase n=1 Tax=Mesorhizobium robiniae TaxID=559315 RepID=A0ABV2GFV4_9HYPH